MKNYLLNLGRSAKKASFNNVNTIKKKQSSKRLY